MRAFLLLVWIAATALDAAAHDYAERIAPIIDPAKLATLGSRGANPRVQKYVFWLESARRDGVSISKLVETAIRQAGYTNETAAQLTRAALLRNHHIAEQLGCFDSEGMAEMKRGNAPTVRRGPYLGQELSVDHIIPRSVVPELDCVIANLELLPLRVNASKNAKIGARQRALAEKLFRAGLLSTGGWKTVYGKR